MNLSSLILAAAVLTGGPSSPVYAHHAIIGADQQSQQLFDRGLTLYYAYNGSEGVHVFQTLERRDPKLAIAYWGEALSYGADINQPLTEEHFKAAHAAIEKAVAHVFEEATPSDRAYIAAMRVRYAGKWSDRDKAERAYRDAMAAAVQANPQDDDLGALYVEALLENTGNHLWKDGTSVPLTNDTSTMVAVLDRIIAHDPTHIMANHLIVHVFETSTDHARAVIAAARLDAMTFAPEDEHLAHMSAHTDVDVGAYAKAVAASKRAIGLFDAYLATPNVDPGHARYILHDITVGYTAAMMLGNYAQASWFAHRLQSSGLTAIPFDLFTSVRFGRWSDLAGVHPKTASDPAHLAIAYAKLAQGDVAGTKGDLDDALDRPGRLHALLFALRGEVAALQGDRPAANLAFKKARAIELDDFGGEMLPLFPMGEIMGATFYRTGDFAAAESAYRATLATYPNDARALYGLSQTLKKLGKNQEAQAVAKAFASVWHGSDTPPPGGL